MTQGPRLPGMVTLPTSPTLSAAHLRHCLGTSKALLHLWRRKYLFPDSFRVGRERVSLTDDVARWCERHGARVIRL